MIIWSLSGCLAPAVIATASFSVAQTGASAYIGGELVSAYVAPLDQVVESARGALEGLEFCPRAEREGELSMYILVRELKGREVGVRLESATPKVTRVKIRVGVWGDQALSQVIQKKIEEELAARAPRS
jgi:hypothetical protein